MKYCYTITFTADVTENILIEHLNLLNACDICISKEININEVFGVIPDAYEIDNLDLLKDVLGSMCISRQLVELICESYLQAKNKTLKNMLKTVYLSCLAYGKTHASAAQLLEDILLFYSQG